MSLGTKEKLNECITFLQHLDLAGMMRDAELIANNNNNKQEEKSKSGTATATATSQIKPFIISLESLHALPKARDATVLHAHPVDPTSRLYPFCVLLQDKFLQAGFLLGESKGKSQTENNINNIDQNASSTVSNISGSGPGSGSRPRLEETTTSSITTESKPPVQNTKTRPLLLHATIVNTIYIKGRNRERDNNNNNRHSNKNRYSFDARDIISRYADYYDDHTRTQPRSRSRSRLTTADISAPEVGEAATPVRSDSHSPFTSSSSSPFREKYPFIWAKDVPIEGVYICEMGAKKVSVVPGLSDPLADRLGEKYRVIAERSLLF